jgi:hypothetical protein
MKIKLQQKLTLFIVGAALMFGKDIIEGMVNFFKNPFEIISNLLGSLGEGIVEWFEEGGFKDFIIDAFEEGKKELVKTFEDLKDIFKVLFKLGYLDAHKHQQHLEQALSDREIKHVSKTMRKFFINYGFQGFSAIPVYACSFYNYEDEPMACSDESVFITYLEKKIKPVIVSRPSRTRSFGSSNLLK